MTRSTRLTLVLLFLTVAMARFCHMRILWVEESYPLAAAAQILDGKFLYRDIWFDKPPLYALFYLLCGTGASLRLLGTLFVALCCALVYRFARQLWGEPEAVLAACLLGFYLTFGIPSAVMALAPDLLMIAPHIAAVYLAWRGKPFWSGLLAGVALLVNSKGVFVLAACAIWQYHALPALLFGFAVPNAVFAAVLLANGAMGAYFAQVWTWGFLYSRDGLVSAATGLARTANWMGFHATIVIAGAWFLRREKRWLAWLLLSLVAVAAGWRFFPRYYFQLLPVFTLAAARGLMLMHTRWRIAVLSLLLIPALRFGPRYATLAGDLLHSRPHEWSDLAMNQDSQKAAGMVRAMARPGDTLLVWGYRPDVFVYSGLPAATRFLDSQPLTGVLADRHLTSTQLTAPEWAARNRQEIAAARPSFIVDGLGLLNPALSVGHFQSLDDYDEVGRTPMSVVYRLRRTLER
ncbi:MAG: hypothetical protein ABJF23_21755 [Bryobacteraceae bacterium]